MTTALRPFHPPPSPLYQTKQHTTHHGDVIVTLNNLTDFSHFLLHIARPDFTDYLTGICKRGWHDGRSGSEQVLKKKKKNDPAAFEEGGRAMNKMILKEDGKQRTQCLCVL